MKVRNYRQFVNLKTGFNQFADISVCKFIDLKKLVLILNLIFTMACRHLCFHHIFVNILHKDALVCLDAFLNFIKTNVRQT